MRKTRPFKVTYTVGQSRRERVIEAVNMTDAELFLEAKGVNWVEIIDSNLKERSTAWSTTTA